MNDLLEIIKEVIASHQNLLKKHNRKTRALKAIVEASKCGKLSHDEIVAIIQQTKDLEE